MEFSSAALMAYEDKRALPTPPASPLPFPCSREGPVWQALSGHKRSTPARRDDCPPPSPLLSLLSSRALPASKLLYLSFLSSAFPLHPARSCALTSQTGQSLCFLSLPRPSLYSSLSGHLPHPLKVTFTFNAPQVPTPDQTLDSELLWAKVAGTSFLPLCARHRVLHIPVTFCD